MRSWAVEFEEDVLDCEESLQEKVDIFSVLEWRRRVPNFLHLSEAVKLSFCSTNFRSAASSLGLYKLNAAAKVHWKFESPRLPAGEVHPKTPFGVNPKLEPPSGESSEDAAVSAPIQ